MENRVYYAAVNRVGTERGFRFIGLSRIADVSGDLLVASDSADDPSAAVRAQVFGANGAKVGTEFLIEGYQARDGTNKAVGRNFTLADGRNFLFGGSAPGAGGSEK